MTSTAYKPGQKARIAGLGKPPGPRRLGQPMMARPKKLMSAARYIERQRWKAEYEKRRPSPTQRGYGKEWRALRESFLQQHPECVVCGRGATVVDHIIPHRGNHEKFWARENLQSMCKFHHDQKTRRGL